MAKETPTFFSFRSVAPQSLVMAPPLPTTAPDYGQRELIASWYSSLNP